MHPELDAALWLVKGSAAVNSAIRPVRMTQRCGSGANAGTQRERILAEMRRRRDAAGPGWITGRDFRAPTCDSDREPRR